MYDLIMMNYWNEIFCDNVSAIPAFNNCFLVYIKEKVKQQWSISSIVLYHDLKGKFVVGCDYDAVRSCTGLKAGFLSPL